MAKAQLSCMNKHKNVGNSNSLIQYLHMYYFALCACVYVYIHKTLCHIRQVCHCLLACKEEDMKWNSQTFNWPAKMDPIFEVSEKRLANQREKAENEVKEK